MTLHRALIGSLLAGGLVATALPADLRAQGFAIEPAETIRVLEPADRRTGRVERLVVADLLPAEVLAVQVALAEAGFDPGAKTGDLDGATRGALRRFQIERGLTICGCVSYETVVALGIVPEVVGAPRYARRDRDRTIVIVPGRRHDHRRRSGAAVVVGGTTGVFVGHAPAIGGGRHGQRSARPRPDDRFTGRFPERPRPGSRIRAGGPDRLRSGPGTDRPRRPRPR